MANDKTNMNELVAEDDDPTAELEVLADTYDFIGNKRKEVDPSIAALETDLQNRSETIDRLQFDIEQLRAKWTGLEVEIEAREDLTKNLNQKLDDARASFFNYRGSLDTLKEQFRIQNFALRDRLRELTGVDPGQNIDDPPYEYTAFDSNPNGELALQQRNIQKTEAVLRQLVIGGRLGFWNSRSGGISQGSEVLRALDARSIRQSVCGAGRPTNVASLTP